MPIRAIVGIRTHTTFRGADATAPCPRGGDDTRGARVAPLLGFCPRRRADRPMTGVDRLRPATTARQGTRERNRRSASEILAFSEAPDGLNSSPPLHL